jgi:hypothetical protein
MIGHRVVALFSGPLAWRSLAVLAVGVAAVVQASMPLRLPAAGPMIGAPRTGLTDAGPAPRMVTVYPAIAEHPLFSPSRKPYAPPPAPAPAVVAASSLLRDYQLLGTVVAGSSGVALLKPPDRSDTIRAIPGQTIAGWTLRTITPDALQFVNGPASFTLRFPHPRWPHP